MEGVEHRRLRRGFPPPSIGLEPTLPRLGTVVVIGPLLDHRMQGRG